MGWIRDLMLAPPGRFRSFGQLSRALLADPSWPQDMKIQERSLSTLLSKLDRGHDLGWLSDRPDVQAVLARLLQCSVGDLVRAPAAEPGAPTRKLRWDDLRYAQPLDLSAEALPPTIPDEVADPSRWDRTFWVAPSGAGRSLVGHWLAARGLAQVRRIEHPSELDEPGEAPLYVELASTRVAIERAPRRRRICLAAPTPPTLRDGFRLVETPPIAERLPALVRWLLARFPSDTLLDEESLLAWLSGPVQSGEADSFGAVVGLAGVLDRVGLGRARGKSVLELARQDARRRFDEAFGAEARDVAWQRRNAIEILVAMARRALTDDTEAFALPRTLEEWIALVPDEHKSGLDVEWLRVSLARVDSSIRPADVERAARRLSPGAFRIVHALSQAGLLARTDEEHLAPAPRWISRAVELEAERQLLSASPFEWGEALLRPHAAPRIAERLFESLRSGDGAVLGDVAELEARESPAYAVAVETTFRCAGLALLCGADLSGEALADVWDAVQDLWLLWPGQPPLPRVEHPRELGAPFQRGAFFLAGLAVAEALGKRWPGERAAAYDAIAETLADASAEWVHGGYALVDRLRRAEGPVGHALEAPGVLLDRVESQQLDWEDARLPARSAEVVRALWRARGEDDLTPVAVSLYRAWQRASFPEVAGGLLDPRSDAGRVFFGLAPPELARTLLERSGDESLVPALGAEAWRLLSEHPPSDPELVAKLGEALPEAWVERWLAEPALRAQVWRRHPERALERLTRDARQGDVASAIGLADAAPSQELEAVIAALAAREELGQLPSPARDALRAWLHRLVGQRRRGWREAYAFLARLES